MLIFLLIGFSLGKIPEEDGVLVLDAETFPSALQKAPKLMVEFYAPWCEHCKKLAPEYSKAAIELRKHKIRFGKVDGDSHRDLVEKYKIKGYPTLIYFVDGVPFEYNGIPTAEGIIDWVQKRQEKKVHLLNSTDSIEDISSSIPILCIYFGSSSSNERSVFEFAAYNVQGVAFYETPHTVHADQYLITSPQILGFRNGVLEKYEGAFSTVDLSKFLEGLKPAKVHDFNDDTAKKIFDYQSKSFFLLIDENDLELHENTLRSLAEEYKTEFIFTSADLAKPGNPTKLAGALGIQAQEMPLAVIVDFDNAFNKYKKSATDLEELRKFIEDYKEKKLEPYLKSQEIPQEEYENSVRVIVGKNHNDVINDIEKDVLVLYCTHDYPKCIEFMPMYERLAKDTKRWEGFLPCKMDLAFNEAIGVRPRFLPHIVLYTKDDKEGMIYSGEFTKGAVKNFLRGIIRKESSDL